MNKVNKINESFGQIYAIIDPFCEQLGGKVQYIGKHKLGKKEADLKLSLEKYLDAKIKDAKSERFKYSKRPHNVYLRNEIRDCFGNIYDKPRIKCIEICFSERELNHREEYWRLFFLGFYPDLLNRAKGGEGGPVGGWKLTEEQKIKRRKPLSEEHKKNISAGKIGKPLSEAHKLSLKEAQNRPEVKMRASNAKKGKLLTDEHKQSLSDSSWNKGFTKKTNEKILQIAKKISFALKGKKRKPLSESQKKKISAKLIGKKLSDNVKKAMSNASKGKPKSEAHKLSLKEAQNRPEVKEANRIRNLGKNNAMYGEHLKDHMTNDKYNAWRKNISESTSGENNGFFGKQHSEESKQKMRRTKFINSLRKVVKEWS